MKKSASPSRRKNSTCFGAFLDLGVGLVTVGMLLFLRYQMIPYVGPATIGVNAPIYQTKTLPYTIPFTDSNVVVMIPFTVSRIRPLIFSVLADDCITHLQVNGRKIIPQFIPAICSPHGYKDIPLGRYLSPGMNVLSITMQDYGVNQALDIRPSRHDPISLALFVAIIIAILWTVWRISTIRKFFPRLTIPLGAVLFFGVLLRILYVSVTDFNNRAYDADAHMEYVDYVARSWTIPHASEGWEFHQPPLYYFLMAALGRVVQAAGYDSITSHLSMQGASIFFSLLTLLILFHCITSLLNSRSESIVAAAFLVSVPGFIFFVSRISNEILFITILSIAVALLLAWWQKGARVLWYGSIVAVGIGFVTKISIIVLLPVMFVLYFVRAYRTKERVLHIAMTSVLSLLLLITLAGWLPVLRFFEPNNTNTLTIGNKDMNRDLQVSRGLREYITFNPIAVTKKPFNDPWKDRTRRMNFFEYFFRSALFGEFGFPKLRTISSVIAALGCLLLIPFFFGIVRSLKTTFLEWLPVHLLFVTVIFGAILYSYVFPYSSNQDFRQSVILLLPTSLYITRGIFSFPPFLRILSIVVAILFAAASASFVLLLFLTT